MDKFLTQKTCDRCGGSLEGGRTMSMFNTECICMACKEKERSDPEYKAAQEADIAEIKKGNYNFIIGLVLVSVYNAITDPTTSGFTDSKQALTYDKPNDDKN